MSCACGNPIARGKRTYCRPCANARQRIWRRDHPLTAEQRAKMNCRSYLHVYVKRGTIVKKPCEICGDPNVEGHHDDHTKPLEVRWLCKEHHLKETAVEKLLKKSRGT